MSALAGIIDFDGAPIPRQDLDRMSQALESFGRDRLRVHSVAGAGFVVRTSHLTPEDRLERQPLAIGPQGIFLFDGRLDNRPALIRQLGLSDAEGRMLADSALAAKAWERWGRDGLIHLIGVFSLAYWHGGQRRLTLALSAPQGNPLYVHRREGRLYFASAPQGLFALREVPRTLNEAALGDLLLRNNAAGETLFQGIDAVCNAHWAEYRSDGLETRRYWAPDPAHRLRFPSEEAGWEAFGTLFEEVVTSHLRAIHPVGIQMSGGLDSAAVAGQAALILGRRDQILHGYTRVPAPGTPLRPDGSFYNDERPRVAQIAAMHPNLRTHFIDAGDEPVLEGLREHFHAAHSVYATSPTFLTGYQKLYRQAAADGVRVLLNGACGNFTFSYDAHARLRTLLLQGRWPTLWRELHGLKRFRGQVGDLIRYELYESLVPNGLRAPWQRRRNGGKTPWSHYSAATLAFAERSGAAGRMQARANIKLYWRRLDSWQRRAWAFSRGYYGGDQALLAQYGLDVRDPTGDRRLVEFCLALPDEFYLKDGIERRLARLGLPHLIPASVRQDPSRGRQDVDWAYRMSRDAAAIGQALEELALDPTIGPCLDLPAMRAQWQGFAAIDWQHAPLGDVIRYKQGLMGCLAVGQFVRWFERRN